MEINIESLVKERIEDMDLDDMVREAINGLITKQVKDEIVKVVQRECLRMVETEIVKCMEGEVKTNDGWGKKETFESFEILFKKTITEKLKGGWEAEKIIAKKVAERVDSIMKDQYAAVVEKIVNELTGSYLKK
jgi:hypothetical protein